MIQFDIIFKSIWSFFWKSSQIRRGRTIALVSNSEYVILLLTCRSVSHTSPQNFGFTDPLFSKITTHQMNLNISLSSKVPREKWSGLEWIIYLGIVNWMFKQWSNNLFVPFHLEWVEMRKKYVTHLKTGRSNCHFCRTVSFRSEDEDKKCG